MSADGQGAVALAIVALAALSVARRAWSTWRSARRPVSTHRSDGCGNGCDCH